MRARNGAHGYGWVSRGLHWLTVVVLVGQFAVGWTMSAGEGYDAAADRLDAQVDAREEREEEAAEGQGEAAEERADEAADRRDDAADAAADELDACEDAFVADGFDDVVGMRVLDGGLSSGEVHVLLGLAVLLLGLVRLVWRRLTPLPPWAEHLSAGERRLEGSLEKAMLTLLLVVPATGLLLVAAGTDWLPVHVAAQVALLVVVGVHVALVLSHTVVRRNRHLARML